MKKFKLFLLAAIASLPLLNSCNDSDIEGADSVALVTVITTPAGGAGSYHFKADNGKTLYPSQIEGNLSVYKPTNGDRAFIYYSLIEEQRTGFDYNIHLYGVSPILTKEVKEMDPGSVSQFGEEAIELVRINSSPSGYDSMVSGGYFTTTFYIKTASNNGKHEINLVRNSADNDSEDPDYIQLELRHKPESDPSVNLIQQQGIASFKLNEYDPALKSKKGLKIRYKDFNGNTQNVKIDLAK